jgi:hypothetical protein
MMMLLAY